MRLIRLRISTPRESDPKPQAEFTKSRFSGARITHRPLHRVVGPEAQFGSEYSKS